MLTDDDSGAGLHIGMVFQSGALFDSLTVGENVGFLLYEHSDLPQDHIKARCSRLQGFRVSWARVGLAVQPEVVPGVLQQGCLR